MHLSCEVQFPIGWVSSDVDDKAAFVLVGAAVTVARCVFE